MSEAGRERVSRFYREESVYAAYDHLYREHLEAARAFPVSQ